MLFDLAAELGVTALVEGARSRFARRPPPRALGSASVAHRSVGASRPELPKDAPPDPGDSPVVARAIAEALPFADESFDFVWICDVLVHIESLRPAFAEVRRVLRAGAPVLVFHVFATPLLEPREAERLWSATAVMPTSADPEVFRRAVADADLEIERWEDRASGGAPRGDWRRQDVTTAASARPHASRSRALQVVDRGASTRSSSATASTASTSCSASSARRSRSCADRERQTPLTRRAACLNQPIS